MSKISHIFSRELPKRFLFGAVTGLGIVAILVLGVMVARAIGPFLPGDETDPNCAPGDDGCDIDWFNMQVNNAVNAQQAGNADKVDDKDVADLFRLGECNVCVQYRIWADNDNPSYTTSNWNCTTGLGVDKASDWTGRWGGDEFGAGVRVKIEC